MEEDIEILENLLKNASPFTMSPRIYSALENLIKGFKEKEEKLKKAYIEANNILYFDDSSDYCGALWDILRIINPDLEDYPTLEYIDEED